TRLARRPGLLRNRRQRPGDGRPRPGWHLRKRARRVRVVVAQPALGGCHLIPGGKIPRSALPGLSRLLSRQIDAAVVFGTPSRVPVEPVFVIPAMPRHPPAPGDDATSSPAGSPVERSVSNAPCRIRAAAALS